MDAEDDTVAALAAVLHLEAQAKQKMRTHLTYTLCKHVSIIPQLQHLEEGLMDSVSQLQQWKHIIGTPLSLNELLNPLKEQEVGDSPYRFAGGDEEIIAEVCRCRSSSRDNSEIEIDEDEVIEEDSKGLSYQQGMEMCEALERACMDADHVDILVLQRELRKLRGYFREMGFKT
jgi:hypothetical protein